MKKSLMLIGLIAAGYLIFISGSIAGPKSGEREPQPQPQGATETVTENMLETRCGWFANPTPGNAWLNDKDAEWIVGEQGGYQAKGEWPGFSKSQWVKTNASYGYGCACIKGTFNSQDHQVVEIKSAYARPLSACKKDKALKAP